MKEDHGLSLALNKRENKVPTNEHFQTLFRMRVGYIKIATKPTVKYLKVVNLPR